MAGAIYATIGLLFVSALSGAAYLAIKHPLTYLVYGKYVLYAVGSLVPGSLIFVIGAAVGIWSVRAHLKPGSEQSVLSISSTIEFVCLGIAFAAVGVAAILSFLARITVHIHDNERREDEGDGKPK